MKGQQYHKEYYQRNKERYHSHFQQWRENNPDYNRSRINFKGRNVQLDHIPRIGICSQCQRTIESGEIKTTNIHHTKYDPNNPLNHTRELCVRCHNYIHRGQHEEPV